MYISDTTNKIYVKTDAGLSTNWGPQSSASLTNTHIFVGNAGNIATDVAMSGDVTIANTGATTVATVGTSTASNIHSAELAANAATNLNTVSTIVKRDGSGNFTAGTITASLSGNATTSTTATNSTNVATTQVSNNASYYPLMVAASANGNQAADLGTSLTFNPSTNTLTTTTFVGALTGTASGNTTYSANQYGVVASGSANAMSVIAPDASTTKVLVSGGAAANPSWASIVNANLSGSAAISNANLASMAANTVKANATGGGATPTDVGLVSTNTASTAVFRDGSGNFSAGTITASLTGASSGNLAKATGDIDSTSFSAANNQAAAANVTGLTFANGTVRSFNALVSVYVNATSPLYETFNLLGIQRGSDWQMSQSSIGDTSGFVFTITTAGQIQYTSGNSSGWVSTTIKFRALSTAV